MCVDHTQTQHTCTVRQTDTNMQIHTQTHTHKHTHTTHALVCIVCDANFLKQKEKFHGCRQLLYICHNLLTHK